MSRSTLCRCEKVSGGARRGLQARDHALHLPYQSLHTRAFVAIYLRAYITRCVRPDCKAPRVLANAPYFSASCATDRLPLENAGHCPTSRIADRLPLENAGYSRAFQAVGCILLENAGHCPTSRIADWLPLENAGYSRAGGHPKANLLANAWRSQASWRFSSGVLANTPDSRTWSNPHHAARSPDGRAGGSSCEPASRDLM